MNELSPTYTTNTNVLPVTLRAFKNRPCALPWSDDNYQPPTPQEVDQLIKLANWSQGDAAKITGVTYNPKKGSSTIRKWRAPIESKDARPIPYSAWRLLLLHARVVTVDDVLKELPGYKNLD